MPFTLAAACDYAEEIRKSRFLARAAPIQNIGDAQAFIAKVSDPGATHNCWAWKLGGQYRFSDDGEPGGTAGRPILTAIEGQDCDGVAVVVTRWYGGIQLGTGGLARAYGGSAAKCLQAGTRLEQILREPFRTHVGFAELAHVETRLAEYDTTLEHKVFDATGAQLHLAVPPSRIEALATWIADLTRGRSRLERDPG